MVTSKQAIIILHEQIVKLLIEDHPDGGNLRCALINDWIIEHDSKLITIKGNAEDSVPPKSPPWLVFEHYSETDTFTVTTEIEPYLYDIIGLLLEAWRIKLESPNHGSEYHIRTAIERIAARWKSQNEPISERDQKALIGELKCVVDASKINGLESIDSWDTTGHALYDLESDNWIIESKATSTEPEIVSISYPEQVDYRVGKILVLGVTKLQKNSKNGKTFPEFIDECLSNLHLSHAKKLETLLTGRGYNKSMSEKYRTKWQIHGTRYLRITQDSPVLSCLILEKIPLTVRKIRYDLNTSNFIDEELSKIIGG